MRRVTLLLILGFTLGYNLSAQSAEELTRTAYDHMEAKQYEKAIASYESLLEQGYSSPGLHHNLGLAYYRNDKLGPAILHLEKALKLAPHDNKAAKNLELIRNEQEDGLLPLPTFFLYDWWHKLAGRLSPDTSSVLAIIFAILGSLGLSFWFRFRKDQSAPQWFKAWRRRLIILAPITLLLALLFVLFASTRNSALARTDQAVLLAPEVEIYATPDRNSSIDFTLHEGLRIRVLDQYEGWNKIELVDGRTGWLTSDKLEII